MTDKRSEVKEILIRNDKNISWLKNRLRSNVDLHYQLSEKSVNFDVNIYEEIIQVFKQEGFITSENERCERFAEQLIQVNGIISHSTYLLNSNASHFIKDSILDYREKKKLLEIVYKMKNEFNSGIEQIEKIIEG
jgi:hypothetical protein